MKRMAEEKLKRTRQGRMDSGRESQTQRNMFQRKQKDMPHKVATPGSYNVSKRGAIRGRYQRSSDKSQVNFDILMLIMILATNKLGCLVSWLVGWLVG